ncbi:MAG TPA: hypothetical protein VF618_12420 [Thermoanaerobaculia bacterium]
MTDELTRSQRAQVLRHSPRAEDREESERIFRELRESAQTDIAHLAVELSSTAMTEKPNRKDPELEAMKTEWMSLRSPMDGKELDRRFERWFAEVERKVELLENLAPKMVASASDWLGEYERVSCGLTCGNDPGLRQFDAWANLARQFRRVAAALESVLARWSEIRSERMIAIHTRDVHAAIVEGDITAALNELRELEGVVDVPEETINELRESIDDLLKRQVEIDAWRKELAGTPSSWRDVVRMYDVWAKGRVLIHKSRTPREWVEGVGRLMEHLRAEASEFVARRAAGWVALDEVRAEIEAIRAAWGARESLLDETWLEPLSSAMVYLIDKNVAVAEEIEILRGLSATVAPLAAALPSGGGAHVQAALARIATIIATWESVESDAVPALLPEGVLPPRFIERLERTRLLGGRVAAAEAAMHRGSTTAERAAACRDTVATLEDILEDAPHHASARALLDRAQARLRNLQLEELIERWDVVGLRKALAATRDSDYTSLAEAMPVFETLAALRQRKPAASLSELASWWQSWRDLVAQLRVPRPESLQAVLDLVRRDTAAAVRVLATDHRNRMTTIDEDRAAEAAVAAMTAELNLRDELFALTQRRTIHAAVVAARAAGIADLAVLIRDSWGTIERHLPGSAAILVEAFERAWDEANDEALDALRDVALRDAQVQRGTERFHRWLEWLDLERSLSASSASDVLRRLHGFLQRDGASEAPIMRRLARLVAEWRTNGDDVALVWARRAFAHLDPPLFAGVDPLLALTRRTKDESAAVLRGCREAAAVDEEFLAVMNARLSLIEEIWLRLEQLLREVPVLQSHDPWPVPPPELGQAKALVGSFERVVSTIAGWTEADLRKLGVECDGVRRVILRDLAAYPAAEALEAMRRKLEPLTRLELLEQRFRDASRRCNSEAPPDVSRRDQFSQAARCLEAVVETLRATLPEGAHTLQVVSEEYWRDIPPLAGDLLPPHATGGLDALRRRFDELQENDALYANAIDALWREQPNIGAAGELDPAAHLDYIALYPTVPPASARVRRRFEDFAARAAQRVILRKSRAVLPEWLQTYVDNISRGVFPW